MLVDWTATTLRVGVRFFVALMLLGELLGSSDVSGV
jgi:hypothetical protein